jgi:hypothetical protein
VAELHEGTTCYRCEEAQADAALDAAIAKNGYALAAEKAAQNRAREERMGAPIGFTEEHKATMRKLRKSGKSYAEIAKAFACSDVTVRKICVAEAKPKPRTGYCMLTGTTAFETAQCVCHGEITDCGPGCVDWRDERPVVEHRKPAPEDPDCYGGSDETPECDACKLTGPCADEAANYPQDEEEDMVTLSEVLEPECDQATGERPCDACVDEPERAGSQQPQGVDIALEALKRIADSTSDSQVACDLVTVAYELGKTRVGRPT